MSIPQMVNDHGDAMWLQVVQGMKLLTLDAFLHVFCAVSLEGQPVITSPKDFVGHCPDARMTTTYSFMDLIEYILNLVVGHTFQQRRRVAHSVQVLVDHGVS